MDQWISRRFCSRVVPIALSFLLVAPFAHAAMVKSVKGKRVIIDMQSDSVSKGEIYYTVRDGKKRGLIKIRAVKGRAALAVLGKGRAAPGDNLELRVRKSSGSQGTRMAKKSSSGKGGLLGENSSWGVLVGLSQTSSTVDLLDVNGNAAGTVDLSGSGFSLKGLFDYPLLPYLGFRGMAGLEQFKVGGETNGVCGGECTADITYISFDFWGRLMFGSDTLKLWGGAGFDLLFPMSKKATALDEGSITNTSIIGFGGGLDWYLSPTSYIPMQIEYGLYPKSDQVEASAIAVRIGYAQRF